MLAKRLALFAQFGHAASFRPATCVLGAVFGDRGITGLPATGEATTSAIETPANVVVAKPEELEKVCDTGKVVATLWHYA